jgi:hypothetical protein
MKPHELKNRNKTRTKKEENGVRQKTKSEKKRKGNKILVRNRTLTLIERENDTKSWGNFLVYFSHSTTLSYSPRGWGYILIGC